MLTFSMLPFFKGQNEAWVKMLRFQTQFEKGGRGYQNNSTLIFAMTP
jgi:hypothetical protein